MPVFHFKNVPEAHSPDYSSQSISHSIAPSFKSAPYHEASAITDFKRLLLWCSPKIYNPQKNGLKWPFNSTDNHFHRVRDGPLWVDFFFFNAISETHKSTIGGKS